MSIKLDRNELSLWIQLIFDLTGISLSHEKEYLIRERLHCLLEKYRCSSLSQLYFMGREEKNFELREDIIDQITTKETSFFRDVAPFEALRTSTPLGDLAEMKAARRVFGDKIGKVTINATKSMIGHLLGAAGAVGSVATILQMQQGFIHPTINLENVDPELQDLDLAPLSAKNKQIDGGLVNSFGFGGQNASVLFAKPE